MTTGHDGRLRPAEEADVQVDDQLTKALDLLKGKAA